MAKKTRTISLREITALRRRLDLLEKWKKNHNTTHRKLGGYQRKIDSAFIRVDKNISGVISEVYRVENKMVFIEQFIKQLAPAAKDTEMLIGITKGKKGN